MADSVAGHRSENSTNVSKAGLEREAVEARLRIPELRKRAKIARWITALVLLGGIIAAGYAYWMKSRPPVLSYRTAAVERRTIVRVVEATGHLDSRLRFEVSAPAPGRLASIAVKEGDSVKTGAVLARLDNRAVALAVQTAAAAREAAKWQAAEAQTALQSAQRERSQVERLESKGLASAQDLSAAQDRETQAQASLRAIVAERVMAESNVAAAKLAEKYGAIVAPIDGVVLRAPETSGIAVSPERGALFIIGESLKTMRLMVDVSEADIGDVRPNQQAQFEVQAYPGRTFVAQVERIGLDARSDAGVVTYPVQLSAINNDGVLLPGMSVVVHIEVARAADALAVREAALRFEPDGAPSADGRTRVFIYKRGAELTPIKVQVGISDGIYTEVKPQNSKNLAVGDLVAVGVGYTATRPSGQPGISLGSKNK